MRNPWQADRSISSDDKSSLFVGSARVSTELTVPHISSSSSLRSSWNDPKSYETSCSTQHLCVPSNRLRTNRYSDGNISLPVPRFVLQSTEPNDEQLLDPRLIPECVRRSLLALHRESQENVNMQRHREKTQSENDVHGSFHPWKIKMKAKLRRTHHHQQQLRPHSNTLAILPTQQNSADRDRPMTDLIAVHSDQRYSTPVSHSHSRATTPTVRRSLIHYTKYSTQSTSESETTTHGDLPPMTTNSNDEQEQEEEKEKGFGETADKILSPSSSWLSCFALFRCVTSELDFLSSWKTGDRSFSRILMRWTRERSHSFDLVASIQRRNRFLPQKLS